MRKPRQIKPNRCYHLISRVASRPLLFTAEERDRFVDLLIRTASFTCLRLLGFSCMTNHIHIYVHLPKPRKVSDRELLAKIRSFYRGESLRAKLSEWKRLQTVDAKLTAQSGGKDRPSGFDELKETYRRRLFNVSEFMKTLRQHCTMSYNGRHQHVGTLWRSRFTCVESRPCTHDMRKALASVDCSPVEGGVCAWPTDYRWCGWTMAVRGNARCRKMYEFAYGRNASSWDDVVRLHEEAIGERIGELEAERGNEMRIGADRGVPADDKPADAPKRFSFKLENARTETAQTIIRLVRRQPMSAAEIGAAVGLKSRHRLTTGYLTPLVKMKLLRLTNPGSPNAPNQKYRATP